MEESAEEWDKEWEAAQQIDITVDLVAAARSQLQFLARIQAVAPHLYQGHAVDAAIARYTHCWLPLLRDHSKSSLSPPLDCSWIWHCHRLNPTQYAQDCTRLFGRLLHSDISDAQPAKDLTKNLWVSSYPSEPFELDLLQASSQKLPLSKSSGDHSILKAAVFRQMGFYYQVSESHYLDPIFLKASLQRYKAFLHLIKKCRKDMDGADFFVPTYDIDLMWHSHQLHPATYAKDILVALGKPLEHDDTDQDRGLGQKLDRSFKRTSELWRTTYGMVYAKAGCMHREESPSPTYSPIIRPHVVDVNSSKKYSATKSHSLQVILKNCRKKMKKRVVMLQPLLTVTRKITQALPQATAKEAKVTKMA